MAQARRTLHPEAQDMATPTLSGLASPRESRDLVSLSAITPARHTAGAQ